MTLSKNIRYLRKQKGWGQDVLADKLGYKSYTTIQKWESGVSDPPLKVLHKLALLFNVDMDDLNNKDLTCTEEWEPKLTAKDERDIRKDLDDILNSLDSDTGLMFDGEAIDDETKELLAASLEHAIRTAKITAKNMGRYIMSIRETVKRLCLKYDTMNPYELARCLGIDVIYQELGQVRGYYFCQNRIKLIYINNNLADYTERFVLSHELGHAVMHPKSCTPFLQTTFWSVNRLEIEANKFASELIIPDSDLQEHWEYTISEFSMFYGVPKEIIELRFKDM